MTRVLTTVRCLKALKASEVVALKDDPTFVYCGRPCRAFPGSKWGNPFKVGMSAPGEIERLLHGEGRLAGGLGRVERPAIRYGLPLSAADAVNLYATWLSRQPELLAALPELRGKVLGCWCCDFDGTTPPARPCHAILLARTADGLPWEIFAPS